MTGARKRIKRSIILTGASDREFSGMTQSTTIIIIKFQQPPFPSIPYVSSTKNKHLQSRWLNHSGLLGAARSLRFELAPWVWSLILFARRSCLEICYIIIYNIYIYNICVCNLITSKSSLTFRLPYTARVKKTSPNFDSRTSAARRRPLRSCWRCTWRRATSHRPSNTPRTATDQDFVQTSKLLISGGSSGLSGKRHFGDRWRGHLLHVGNDLNSLFGRVPPLNFMNQIKASSGDSAVVPGMHTQGEHQNSWFGRKSLPGIGVRPCLTPRLDECI